MSPLLIFRSNGIAPAPFVGMYAVAGAGFFAWVTCTLSVKLSWLRPLNNFRELRSKGLLTQAFTFGLGAFFIYPLLFFSAIQSGPPALANLVNYLWPIVGMTTVAIFDPSKRRPEVGLSVLFGFGGAALAVTVGASRSALTSANFAPFAFAGAGALTYGLISAYSNLSESKSPRDQLRVMSGGLWLAAATCFLFVSITALLSNDTAVQTPRVESLLALALYAMLMPAAHFSWLTAVGTESVAAFSSVYAVPVISTVILAIFVSGTAQPELIAAMVLVLCGIGFANATEQGIRVSFAVALSFLGSIQVSQVLSSLTSQQIGSTETALFAQLLVELMAIASAFMLANAIKRHNQLRISLTELYKALSESREDPSLTLEQMELTHKLAVTNTKVPYSTIQEKYADLANEWSSFTLAVENRVSFYEWTVLTVGGVATTIGVHIHGVESSAFSPTILRAAIVAVIAGLVFAIRDYDLNRPDMLRKSVEGQRILYDLPQPQEDPSNNANQKLKNRLQNISLTFITALALASVLANGLALR